MMKKVKEFSGFRNGELEESINHFIETNNLVLIDVKYQMVANNEGNSYSCALLIYREAKQ
ncbi:hypothetical protein IWT25_02441 [Secundilactobacillus pentosiphilus]|uniref:Sporulation protein cse60 n=1 Tax=Secundilactobacillus pentosiphilus TaxID=1714682 RepID=A0A1Z5IZ88_9LACO|nr:sporulation protein Cse60 [Secundilactobacillus pentosiphilus]GAX07093.1 hypothetical protein IWT25_02441 [Secundilactobacillus pentosiphilus]